MMLSHIKNFIFNGWVNWCFWTVVLEKTLESPLDCKEIQPVHSKGNQSWVFLGRTDTKGEAPILWPPMWRGDSFEKTLMLGKFEGERRRGQQRMRWLVASLTQWTWTLGVCDGQGGLTCYSPWGCKESDRLSDWTELNQGRPSSVWNCSISPLSWSQDVIAVALLKLHEPWLSLVYDSFYIPWAR